MFLQSAIAAEEFEVKPVGFQIVWDTMKAEITLEAKKEWPAFSAVRFYDGEGNEIQSEAGGHSRFSMIGNVTESRTFRLATKPEKFRVEMDVWSDMESITVPFSVNAGLGL